MKFKLGVKVFGIRPELMLALQVAGQVFREFSDEFIVTSVTEGRHSRTSLHYAGQAADIRTRHLGSETTKKGIADAIRDRLTDEFDVVLEPTHIHIEFQPKRPK